MDTTALSEEVQKHGGGELLTPLTEMELLEAFPRLLRTCEKHTLRNIRCNNRYTIKSAEEAARGFRSWPCDDVVFPHDLTDESLRFFLERAESLRHLVSFRPPLERSTVLTAGGWKRSQTSASSRPTLLQSFRLQDLSPADNQWSEQKSPHIRPETWTLSYKKHLTPGELLEGVEFLSSKSLQEAFKISSSISCREERSTLLESYTERERNIRGFSELGAAREEHFKTCLNFYKKKLWTSENPVDQPQLWKPHSEPQASVSLSVLR
ncbi:hypothetical protein DNTS_014647 [Danionella cerebrum]|uniref:Uncharacterized protein n=1 Tax=Danionella cerebrum TaxID=2873325 RepID=A0A553R8K6_9TELE|nr:hypothetical protein DNTS_014647 [Danionella translucida]